jgi:hypothetical protein
MRISKKLMRSLRKLTIPYLIMKEKATLSIGVSYDLIDDKPCGSSSTSYFCTKIDKSSCNESLIMENDLLKKEVTCLTNDLRKCYDSRAKFNHCWASQKFTLNK